MNPVMMDVRMVAQNVPAVFSEALFRFRKAPEIFMRPEIIQASLGMLKVASNPEGRERESGVDWDESFNGRAITRITGYGLCRRIVSQSMTLDNPKYMNIEVRSGFHEKLKAVTGFDAFLHAEKKLKSQEKRGYQVDRSNTGIANGQDKAIYEGTRFVDYDTMLKVLAWKEEERE